MTLRQNVFQTVARPADSAPLPTTAAAPLRFPMRLFTELAAQDWLVLGYLTTLMLAVATRPDGPGRSVCLAHVGPLLLFAVVVLILVRGRLVRDRIVAPIAYRLAIHGTVQASYFMLRDLLPFVNPRSLDAQLAAVDARWFHYEPALAWDGFMTAPASEWFAFFYLSYFALLAVHVIPIVYFSRSTHLVAEFAFGVLCCFAVGHLLYMVVPGYGPVQYFAHRFEHPFPRGFWMRLMLDAVATGGAQKDIFPSLHTAGPTFVALFSFRHRREMPFKYTWPFVAFFVGNIIIATMFLRWHYLIDVVAGLALASGSLALSSSLCPREAARRRTLGLSSVWTPIGGAALDGARPLRDVSAR